MAVIKSSALGQARKSIGATNYYRRAGVQLARSKPTFAPGRVFSGAQLVSQKNMALVQTMLLTYAGKMVAPYSNCSIKRIYSASSRYNRLVGGILKKVSADNLSAATDVEDFWFDDGVKHLGNWSTGNTVLQVKVKSMQYQSFVNYLTVEIERLSLDSALEQANKRRAQSSWYGYPNICVCGFGSETGGFTAIAPTAGNVTAGESTVSIRYKLVPPQGSYLTATCKLSLSLFIASVDAVTLKPSEFPVYGTSNMLFTNIIVTDL